MQYTNVPYTLDYDYRLIKLVRQIRDLTLAEFGEVVGIHWNTVAQLEKGLLEFTPLYMTRFHEGLKKLNISPIEMASLELLLTIKRETGK